MKNAAIFAPSDTVGSALTAYAESEGFANYHVFADKKELLANISEYSHIIAAENIDEIANSTVHLMIHAISSHT